MLMNTVKSIILIIYKYMLLRKITFKKQCWTMRCASHKTGVLFSQVKIEFMELFDDNYINK